ncbi:MAG: serine/threonine-protein kinase [Clostridiales bacterium]|nr:serine/threonine-protein kinase [Clostridiales bacterium]
MAQSEKDRRLENVEARSAGCGRTLNDVRAEFWELDQDQQIERILQIPYDYRLAWVTKYGLSEVRALAKTTEDLAARVESYAQALRKEWKEEFLSLNGEALLKRFSRESSSFLGRLRRRCRRDRKLLLSLRKDSAPLSDEELRKGLEALADYQEVKKEFEKKSLEAKVVLFGHYKGANTDWAKLYQALDACEIIDEYRMEYGITPELEKLLGSRGPYLKTASQLRAAMDEYWLAQNALPNRSGVRDTRKEKRMEGLLKTGTELFSENGTRYTVKKCIGSGSQGEVYEVSGEKETYALKWYFPSSATDIQKKILRNLLSKGSPDDSFLWPRDMISLPGDKSFGYIMKLRPQNYKSIIDLMKRKAEPSFYMLCRAAYNLTRGYEKLHARGYSYRDISFGNLFFDPENGEVLICDNDNVSVNSWNDSGVLGTPGFMAPEIVLGKAYPSRNTDLHSLAVLLFYMFFINHPLNGRLEANIKCMDLPAMERLYGSDPVFIFDPDDRRNRPVRGIHDNAIIYWGLYPEYLKNLFTQAFTVGLKSPNRRVTERQWMDAISELMSGIMICPHCGAENFYDEAKERAQTPHICWNCSHALRVPRKLLVGRHRILMTQGTKLRSHHIHNDYDMDTVVGTVAPNPRIPDVLGLRNETGTNWVYKNPDGGQTSVTPGKNARVQSNARISFGSCEGEFR